MEKAKTIDGAIKILEKLQIRYQIQWVKSTDLAGITETNKYLIIEVPIFCESTDSLHFLGQRLVDLCSQIEFYHISLVNCDPDSQDPKWKHFALWMKEMEI